MNDGADFRGFGVRILLRRSSVSVLSVSAKPASSLKVTLRVIAGNSALDMDFKVWSEIVTKRRIPEKYKKVRASLRRFLRNHR